MAILNATSARKNFFKLMKDAVTTHEPIYITGKKGCVVELLMKDNHTLGGNPCNITRWVEIAREEVVRIYG